MTDTDRRRRVALLWGTVCLAGFAVIAALVVAKWQPLQDLDTRIGTGPELFTYTHAWVRQTALVIQWLFEFVPMTVFTVVTAGLLVWRNHRRAAIYTVAVMITATVLVDVLKGAIGRKRPVWEDPVTILKSSSFPSGHSVGIAAAASIAIVLAVMLIRRRGLRRAVVVAAVVVALVVGADRVFLGVHNASDVVGGWLLGAATGLFWLAFFDPLPRSLSLAAPALPEVFPSDERTVAVVLNPSKVDDPDDFVTMVEAMATQSGWSRVLWYRTTVEDPGVGQAEAAAVAGADLVITCGGDGTVRTVCEELAGTGIPVGIVPAGTGNLLARNLELPLYLRAAVDVALNGQDRAIDMVRVTGDRMDDATFLVMAGMGFDAAIMEGVNDNVQGPGRLAGVRRVGAALADVPRRPGRGLRRRRPGHPAPRPHGRDRQRRLPAGRHPDDPRRGDRRRPARRGAALPAPVPVLAAARRRGC